MSMSATTQTPQPRVGIKVGSAGHSPLNDSKGDSRIKDEGRAEPRPRKGVGQVLDQVVRYTHDLLQRQFAWTCVGKVLESVGHHVFPHI